MTRIILLAITLLATTAVQAQEAWTLQRCIDHAFEHNIQIKQSQLNLELTEITKQQNVGTMLPSLNASASHGYNWGQTIDPFTNQFATERIRSNSLGIGTNLTIFNGFQNLNRVRQSNVDIEAQRAELERMQNDVALNVSNAFLNVLFQEEFLKIADFNVSNTQQQAERIRALVEAGAAPEGDLFEIEAQLASDQAAKVSAENNLNIAYLNLRQLILLPDEEAPDFSIQAPEMPVEEQKLPPSARAAVSNALNSFPEIKSAQAGLASAENGLKIAQGGRSPRLTASFSYGSGYSGARTVPVGDLIPAGTVPVGFVEGTGEVVVAPDFEYSGGFETKPFDAQIRDNVNQSLFFNLQIPIFNGFSVKGNIDRARVNLKSAELGLEQTRQTLRQNVESAYADALAAYNNYRAAEQSVRAAELAMEYATVRYEEGASTIVEYTQARTRLDNARADLVRNKYDYLFRTKVVEFYMGQPLTFR